MRLFPTDLRKTMTAAIVTVAFLAVLAASALIGLTTMLHRASARSAAAVEGLRLAEAMQRGLLLHDGLRDDLARRQIAGRLRERLTTIQSHLVTDAERGAFVVTERAVSSYLTAYGTPMPDGELATKYGEATASVEKLVLVELDESARARATVKHYDELGDIMGGIIALVVVLASAFIVWWLHARALRPLFELALKMRRFGAGNVDERAIEEGPDEVAEMARRFNEMATAIARQRNERQTFIAGVVHDLRNPLSVLRMSTDVVAHDGADLPPERMKKVLGAVGRQVDRLERMVGDLLDSVSIEAGNVRLRLGEHDARDIAREVVSLYAPSSATHTIHLDIPTEPVPLRCDSMRIEQVLSNLVSNAIKYSPAGGRVSVQVEAKGKDVTFLVRDEGVGMSEEDAANAFEPFKRSASMRDQVQGSGLGLFIVRRLVEAHGGKIVLDTTPGAGSTFEVRLPAVADE